MSTPTICQTSTAIDRIARWNNEQFRLRQRDARKEAIETVLYFLLVFALFALAASIQ